MSVSFLEGNEAIAHGAMAAGCRFFAGYPITPATTIFNAMLRLLPPAGGICMQGEDEIASIGFCIGASMAGFKSMTATSGPGISLFSEQISFAVGAEVPLVIVDVQRLGPSTGSATRGADGDIQFLRWGNSGGLPVIVLAPSDVGECFTLTLYAFNLAEIYRVPVFLAANKEISMTRETVDLSALDRPAIVDRRPAPAGAPFEPYAASGDAAAPDFLPMGGDRLVRCTSSTHGPDGYITTDPEVIGGMIERMAAKLEVAVDRFTLYSETPAMGAETLVIAYGVTARAARAAVRAATAAGVPVSLLVLKTLWPVPEALIREKAEGVARIIVPEMNLGQYVREIRRILPGKRVDSVTRMDGTLLPPSAIEEEIHHG